MIVSIRLHLCLLLGLLRDIPRAEGTSLFQVLTNYHHDFSGSRRMVALLKLMFWKGHFRPGDNVFWHLPWAGPRLVVIREIGGPAPACLPAMQSAGAAVVSLDAWKQNLNAWVHEATEIDPDSFSFCSLSIFLKRISVQFCLIFCRTLVLIKITPIAF
jgi:hypothetical protein